MSIRVLIVDDEPLARDRLRRLLGEDQTLEIVGECSHGLQAVESIQSQHPDLVLLDVQMPELDGFGVLAALEAQDVPLPAVIFTTAYDTFAVKAFEVHAIDYLLKPFDEERLASALTKARRQLEAKEPEALRAKLSQLLNETKPKTTIAERISIKSSGRIILIKPTEIDWIEAADNYVSLHVGKAVHLLRETMNAMEARLDPTKFLRISRSMIVNTERVKEMHPLFHGDYALILHDGTKLNSSRNYRDQLKSRFGC
jgi:two-component system LytT family response regulator